jgi:hypothetical protein
MRCNYVMLGLFMVPLLAMPDKKAEDRDCHTYREELDRIGQLMVDDDALGRLRSSVELAFTLAPAPRPLIVPRIW